MKKQGQQTGNSYQIPSLRNINETLLSLQEMDVKTTVEELNNPTPEAVLRVLSGCMNRFLADTKEEIQMRNREYMTSADAPVQIRENPDMYAHAIEFIELYKKM